MYYQEASRPDTCHEVLQITFVLVIFQYISRCTREQSMFSTEWRENGHLIVFSSRYAGHVPGVDRTRG